MVKGVISVKHSCEIEKRYLIEKLLKILVLTQANISNIEKGMSKPTIDSLKRIADALGKRLRIEFEDQEEIW